MAERQRALSQEGGKRGTWKSGSSLDRAHSSASVVQNINPNENSSVSLPSIDRRQRPVTIEGTKRQHSKKPFQKSQSFMRSPTKQSRSRSRSSEPNKRDWIFGASAEGADIHKLEDRFRNMHAQETMMLEKRMQRFTAEHSQLMSRSTQVSPLVVCVLDKFASSGGLLRTYAGQDISFALQVKYSFAGHLGEGGEDLRSWVDASGGFSCTLTGPVTLEADVVYQGAGVFVFFYKPTVSGTYSVSVRLGKGDVPGSPFESIVEAGKTSTEKCGVSGLGLLCAEAGVEASFTLTSRDVYSNPKRAGGDRYDVGLTGPVCFNAKVTDLNNGTYLCKYNTIMCGDYYVSVRREGVPLPGSPFVLSVVAGKTHGPSSTALGDGLLTAFAGHEAEFIIEGRDIIGNQRVVGDDPFHVAIEGPSTPQISVFDRDDGTYLVSYVVSETGQYSIRVSLHDLQIAGSPFTSTVMPGRVVAVRCTGVGRGLTRAYAGEDAKFTIESRDIHRNKTTSGRKPFGVSIRGLVSPQVHCIPGDNGEYYYSYRTARAGVYFVSVLHEGVDIGGSPFKLTVDPGPTHANGCSAAGPGITGGYTGVETSFVIQARDYYGNPRTTGGDVFNIEVGGTASARLRIRDNENGTYTVAYTPEVGGDYFISARINGIDIQDSPFTVSSDSMPREAYLQMYRAIEPDFGRKLQGQMMGAPDATLSQKEEARKKKKGGKGAGSGWELNIKLLNGKDLVAKDTVVGGDYGTTFTQSSDPYVVFTIGNASVKSKTIEKTLEPEWNEELSLTVRDRMQRLEIEVFDQDVADDDDSMGKASISLVDLVEGKPKMVTAKLKGYEPGSGGKATEEFMGEVSLVLTMQPGKGKVDGAIMR